ncbi:MAG: YigZ family protein [Candidatus Palauibacterales bacterium]|nr:YigZ family protein [Candidatus Palauibacterales bacterium]
MKGSRFLARAFRARDDAAARRAREESRSRHHDATHHCYAIRPVRGDARWDDDGEPSGTAGRPILTAIEGAGLFDAAVVVVRWFGGTELGTGGLARAYGDAAEEALSGLTSTRCRPGRRMEVEYAYDDTGAVMRAVEASAAVRRDERYGDRATLVVDVPEDGVEALRRRLQDATSGRAELRSTGEAVLVPDAELP